jgi:hypothetical protein
LAKNLPICRMHLVPSSDDPGMVGRYVPVVSRFHGEFGHHPAELIGRLARCGSAASTRVA